MNLADPTIEYYVDWKLTKSQWSVEKWTLCLSAKLKVVAMKVGLGPVTLHNRWQKTLKLDHHHHHHHHHHLQRHHRHTERGIPNSSKIECWRWFVLLGAFDVAEVGEAKKGNWEKADSIISCVNLISQIWATTNQQRDVQISANHK